MAEPRWRLFGWLAIVALVGSYLGGRQAWGAFERARADEARAEAHQRARVAWAQLSHCLLGNAPGTSPYRRYRAVQLVPGLHPPKEWPGRGSPGRGFPGRGWVGRQWPGNCVPIGERLLAAARDLGLRPRA